ncbi:MAG TPA: ATP-binding protein [Thermoplasmatales archaeon]|nr:ATP-binding protein [Thermoplasmatales archaeon]
MTQIREILVESNIWWKEPFHIDYKEREIYEKISKFLPLPQIIALTGLRRVGKTTLLFKIIEDEIKNGFNPKNIIYFSFDEFRKADVRDIIREYEEIMKKKINEGKHLLLFDEIQKLENWEEKIKRIYDIYSKNVKIIISGSESLFIRRKSKETLAGRLFEFKINPLSFKEFLTFKNKKFDNVELYEKELSMLFEEFITTQGFPELVGIKEKEIIKKYIEESIVEKVIYRDIPHLVSIRDPSTLESALNTIREQPGQLIELSEFAKEMHISRQTLSIYLKYLEDSFLIRKLYNYSSSIRKTERKLKKYYPSIISTNLIFKDDTYSRSKVFENVIVNQLHAEYFWRDPYKNEVDVILPNKKPIPVEIKYGKIETKNIRRFMEKFHAERGYIISLNQEKNLELQEGKISVVPVYKFLLRWA